MSKTVRNSNLELLRLLAMYMIVFIHANMYLGWFCSGGSWQFFNGLVNGVCNIGVSCFILISGYYGLRFELRKLVKMECMMISFSILETLILLWVMPDQLQGAALLEQLVKSFFPFITRKYWFYSSYVCLFLLSGYLQKLVDSLKEKEMQRLLLLLVCLFSVLPTFAYFELVPDNGKGLVQMIMVYLIGRYIRLYRDVKMPRKIWGLFLACWIINGISHEIPLQIGNIYHHWCKDNSITNLIMAVILFYQFKNLRIQSALINRLAAVIFAVFALNNSLTGCMMRLIRNSSFNSPDGVGGFLTLVGVVLVIMLVCMLIGVIREGMLQKADRWVTEKVCKKQEYRSE